jgi:hypothetical protein
VASAPLPVIGTFSVENRPNAPTGFLWNLFGAVVDDHGNLYVVEAGHASPDRFVMASQVTSVGSEVHLHEPDHMPGGAPVSFGPRFGDAGPCGTFTYNRRKYHRLADADALAVIAGKRVVMTASPLGR